MANFEISSEFYRNFIEKTNKSQQKKPRINETETFILQCSVSKFWYSVPAAYGKSPQKIRRFLSIIYADPF